MKIDVSSVVSTPDEERVFPVEIQMTSFEVSSGVFPVHKKQPFDICLTNENNQWLAISGRTYLEILIPCDRCLEHVVVPFAVSVEYHLPIRKGLVFCEDGGEAPFLEEQQLDVDKLIYDEILVNWPAKVLCKDDCRGICPVCGQNLNRGDCGCDSQTLDPRMAKFQDVFQELKEV